ncbi:MAG: 23S rRNA (pseudouridine(1915)-N(3))-methyltransferase RlmH [Christensenellaceae bacterium]|nr:23S rRNA (pseudouridine(1915)-N(3))-methyltransferase RlmH [Christensenellaceae bacterium]
MNFAIICVGKIKEKFYSNAINEYLKRLSSYIKIEIIEVDDEREPNQLNQKNIEILLEKEAERIFQKLKQNDYIVALTIDGNQFSSEKFADKISQLKVLHYKRIVFLIGGSLGLSENIIKKANEEISFSKMTFPHQLIRVILLEQLYRSEKIQANERYHK